MAKFACILFIIVITLGILSLYGLNNMYSESIEVTCRYWQCEQCAYIGPAIVIQPCNCEKDLIGWVNVYPWKKVRKNDIIPFAFGWVETDNWKMFDYSGNKYLGHSTEAYYLEFNENGNCYARGEIPEDVVPLIYEICDECTQVIQPEPIDYSKIWGDITIKTKIYDETEDVSDGHHINMMTGEINLKQPEEPPTEIEVTVKRQEYFSIRMYNLWNCRLIMLVLTIIGICVLDVEERDRRKRVHHKEIFMLRK